MNSCAYCWQNMAVLISDTCHTFTNRFETALLSEVQYVGKYLGFASTKAHPGVLPLVALRCGSHLHVCGFTFIPICHFLQVSQLLKSTWLTLWDLVLFQSLFVPSLRRPRLAVSVHASSCWDWTESSASVHHVSVSLSILSFATWR